MKVIGVVGNEHQMGPDQPEHPEFYIPGHEMRDLYVVTANNDNRELKGTVFRARSEIAGLPVPKSRFQFN